MVSGLALGASCAVAGRHGGRRCRTGHQICPVVRRGAAAAEVVRGGRCARRGHDHPAGGGAGDIVAPSRWRAVGGPAQGAVLRPGVPVGGHRRGDLEVQALRDRHRDQQGTAVRHARCVHLSRLRRTGGRRRHAGWRPAQPAAVSNRGRRRGGDLPSRSAAGRAACEPDRVRQAGQPLSSALRVRAAHRRRLRTRRAGPDGHHRGRRNRRPAGGRLAAGRIGAARRGRFRWQLGGAPPGGRPPAAHAAGHRLPLQSCIKASCLAPSPSRCRGTSR